MLKVKHIPHYTYEDYKIWKGDWELIEGLHFAMSPCATGKHQFISVKLSNQIMSQLEAVKCINNSFVYTDLDWIIDNDTVVRPDIAVMCGNKVDEFIITPPVLIVEIISKSSVYRDRIVKKELYELNKVKYYLIADPDTKTIEMFELIDDKYMNFTKSEFTLNESCKIVLNFSGIW